MSAVVAVATLGVTVSVAQPAQAAGAFVHAAGDAAWTLFNDKGDVITIVDNARDNEGAVGWIEVQQANGSYKAFPHVYNGKGLGGGPVAVTQDVLRETSRMKVVSCIQNGPHGKPYNCGWKYVSGS